MLLYNPFFGSFDLILAHYVMLPRPCPVVQLPVNASPRYFSLRSFVLLQYFPSITRHGHIYNSLRPLALPKMPQHHVPYNHLPRHIGSLCRRPLSYARDPFNALLIRWQSPLPCLLFLLHMTTNHHYLPLRLLFLPNLLPPIPLLAPLLLLLLNSPVYRTPHSFPFLFFLEVPPSPSRLYLLCVTAGNLLGSLLTELSLLNPLSIAPEPS